MVNKQLMQIKVLDHLVLTVKDIQASCAFYGNVLGMQVSTFADNRTALHFGQMKINLHQLGHEFEPKAQYPTPGSADLCFMVEETLDDVMAILHQHNIPLELEPSTRTGACGKITSIYIRDPDNNLIELANYPHK